MTLPLNKTGVLTVTLLSFLLFFGCGYQMVGKETHVPPGLSSLAIPTFKNLTFEPGIEVPFTQALLRELIQDRRVKVVDRGQADTVLEGVVKVFNISSVSYDKSGLALEYRTNVVLDITLKSREGKVLWEEKNLSEVRWFRASSNVLTNEARKVAAIQETGRFVAERLRSRFFYNF
jgi:outer membrane lipopolysaccharide assembly protein LptE/RlpB